MLQQSNLFLQFSWVAVHRVGLKHVLLLVGIHRHPLVIEESGTFFLHHDLGGIVEEDTGGIVGQLVSQPILGAIVYEFRHIHRIVNQRFATKLCLQLWEYPLHRLHALLPFDFQLGARLV